jgi:Flp pilus assembly protein TadG
MVSRRCSRRSGQVLLMVTMALIPMFGIMGLVTDLGYMHFVKMSAQTAAEAAAQAAIISYHETVGGASPTCGVGGVVCSPTTPTNCPSNITTPTNSIERGCMYAQSHGFNSANKWVTYQANVGSVPPTAPGMGNASYWVTFRVIQKVPQMFSAVLGNTSGMVAARSTTAVIGASDCIYALNPTQSGAVSIGGTADLVSSCGIFVDSSDPCAISTNGAATLQAPEYDVVGNVCTKKPLVPTANTGLYPAADPLASLPVPASAPYTCDHIGSYSPFSDSDLYPGVYCGGIHVRNATYTFHAGTYILVGGGLSTQSANSHIVSTGGVTIYNTFGATTNSFTYSYTGIQIGANSTVSLIAPTSGTYTGILFFEDRASPAASDSYGGGGTAVYQGVIYAKNAAVTMHGNSSVSTEYTMLVADTITMLGTSGFNNNYSSLVNGSPIQQTVMVE